MTAVSTSLGRTIEPPAGSDQRPLVAPERSEVETTRFGEWRSGRCGVGCAAESLPVSSELIRERLVDRHGGHVGHLGHDLLQANQRDSVDNTGQCGELVVVFVASVRGDRGSELAALFGKGAGIYLQLLRAVICCSAWYSSANRCSTTTPAPVQAAGCTVSSSAAPCAARKRRNAAKAT